MSLKDLAKKVVSTIRNSQAKKKSRKPPIKSESKTWQKQFLSGKYPKNSTTAILVKYTNPTKGTPNKRALRSRKAREEYNKALEKFNRERMTKTKQDARDKAIREKQLAHVAANVAPEFQEKAKAEHAFMLDVITTVHDDLSTNAKYEAYMALVDKGFDVKGLDADEISKFIIDAYNKYLDKIPSFAKEKNDSDPKSKIIRENKFVNNLTKIIDDTKSTDLNVLKDAIIADSQGKQAYTDFLRNLRKEQKRKARK